MISRVTVFSLLFGVLLGLGIHLHTMNHFDDCDRYLAGDTSLPSTQWVQTGTRMVRVPCNNWIMRQTMRVQLLCLLDLALAIVFVLNAAGDLRDGLERRRRRWST